MKKPKAFTEIFQQLGTNETITISGAGENKLAIHYERDRNDKTYNAAGLLEYGKDPDFKRLDADIVKILVQVRAAIDAQIINDEIGNAKQN